MGFLSFYLGLWSSTDLWIQYNLAHEWRPSHKPPQLNFKMRFGAKNAFNNVGHWFINIGSSQSQKFGQQMFWPNFKIQSRYLRMYANSYFLFRFSGCQDWNIVVSGINFNFSHLRALIFFRSSANCFWNSNTMQPVCHNIFFSYILHCHF